MAEDRYDPQAVETRWQARWESDGLDQVQVDPTRPPFYALEMYPYPSGDLHMGHIRNYSIGDVIARFYRMRGYNVLHPMGWDSFGLPAENAAIQRGVHPARWTEANIANMRRQLKRMGFSYDWEREVTCSSPDYYRWTQWLFLFLYRRGLAYRKQAPVNWCPECQTVLANEQVVAGRCWRCESPVTRKDLEQWFFRITAYADRLLDDLKLLEGWPERVRAMQEHWIGRSHGAEIHFAVQGTDERLTVFTTRHDTVYGATFMVLAPEHPLVLRLAKGTAQEAAVEEFVERTARLGAEERAGDQVAKEGVFTGGYATNPMTGEPIPIWVANYVLMEYGTGAIQAVPAHDQRDLDFARQYGLPVRVVIQPPGVTLDAETMTEAYDGEGIMVNSGSFDGMPSAAGREAVADYLERHGLGRRATSYRLRDWLVSRQRYWGAPIPIVYCRECGVVPVPEDRLPVLLPPEVDIRPRGMSPLETAPDFVQTSCPHCGRPARRETDTMDTFVDSSWYYLRFCSPKAMDGPFDPAEVSYWMPVHQYTGGIEHAVLHLLYSRFFVKVLHDAGLVRFQEPFRRLLTQGMVTKEGQVMSKSRGNVVPPDEIVEKYGADALRLFILFAAPPEQGWDWPATGVDAVEPMHRYLQRVWRLVQACRPVVTAAGVAGPPAGPDAPGAGEETVALRRQVHRALAKATNDIAERYNFNTAVSALMEMTNALYHYRERVPAGRQDPAALREGLEILLRCLAPFVPHLAEEAWAALGHTESAHRQAWPQADPDLVRAEEVTVVIQVNGRVRDRMTVAAGTSESDLVRLARERERVSAYLRGKSVVQVVTVPDRLVNLVAR